MFRLFKKSQSKSSTSLNQGQNTIQNKQAPTTPSLGATLKHWFSSGKLSEHWLRDLKHHLQDADLPLSLIDDIVIKVQGLPKSTNLTYPTFLNSLKPTLLNYLAPEQPLNLEINPLIYVLIGTNGVGKTSTAIKLAHHFKKSGRTPLLVPTDTFRAAAHEQLTFAANRANLAHFDPQNHKDPAAITYQAIEKAKKDHYDTLIIDTAGRMHTNKPLMAQLHKTLNIIQKFNPDYPTASLLVLEASSGQTTLNTAKEYLESGKANGLILTKMDGTAKAGFALSVSHTFNLPIRYLTFGETIEQLAPFNAEDYINRILLP
jgi:fused signal recognition particle receptor